MASTLVGVDAPVGTECLTSLIGQQSRTFKVPKHLAILHLALAFEKAGKANRRRGERTRETVLMSEPPKLAFFGRFNSITSLEGLLRWYKDTRATMPWPEKDGKHWQSLKTSTRKPEPSTRVPRPLLFSSARHDSFRFMGK